MITSLLRHCLPSRAFNILQLIKHRITHDFRKTSYSQEAEDLLMYKVFKERNKLSNGFYIDIGAHHPIRFSNTYLFYKMGWRGINIDPVPGMKQKFDFLRPRDINIEAAISNNGQSMTYYAYDEGPYNTFNADLVEQRKNTHNLHPKQSYSIKTIAINELLKQHCNAPISFLSIDVECMEFNILSTWDFDLFKPHIICVEVQNFKFNRSFDDYPVILLLIKHGYEIYAKCDASLIFRQSNINKNHNES